jgi:large subunit ribosomal protein L13
MKMTSVKAADLNKKWYVVDATDLVVGRLASHIAYVLRGKHKANFVPHLDCGDHVVVINADKVKFTGNKWRGKIYNSHTNHMGGIKARMAEDVLKNHPERILETAVRGMLPHTKLGARQIHSLKIYAGSQHPHEAQKPMPLVPRLNRK